MAAANDCYGQVSWCSTPRVVTPYLVELAAWQTRYTRIGALARTGACQPAAAQADLQSLDLEMMIAWSHFILATTATRWSPALAEVNQAFEQLASDLDRELASMSFRALC